MANYDYHPTRTLRERFEEKYEPEPNSGCWLWIGSWNDQGYGEIRSEGGRAAEKLKAHRVSYGLFIGPVPDGLDVCHKCDTPCCVNPDHLFLGSRFDNMQDMASKGRGQKSKRGLPWGVSTQASLKRPYCVVFLVNMKRYTKGGYRTPEEAHQVAVKWRQQVLREMGVSQCPPL